MYMDYASSEYAYWFPSGTNDQFNTFCQGNESALQVNPKPPSNEKNLKQETKTKQHSSLFSCFTGINKTKSKKYKSKTQKVHPESGYAIKIKNECGFDQLEEVKPDFDDFEGILPSENNVRPNIVRSRKPPLVMKRKFSTKNDDSSSSQQISSEILKSAILSSCKTSTQSVSSVNRRIDPTMLSHNHTTESIKSDSPLNQKLTSQGKEKEKGNANRPILLSRHISAPPIMNRRPSREIAENLLDKKFSSQSINSPKTLSRKRSAESIKSSILLRRKSSLERKPYAEQEKGRIKAPVLLSRRITEESLKLALSRKSSETSVESDKLLENKLSSENKDYLQKEEVNKIVEETEEETSDVHKDLHSFSAEDVLLYICLDENVKVCQKCKTLQHIFKSQKNYILYKLPLQTLQNPNELDLQDIPTWLELVLWSILAEKKTMTIRVKISDDTQIQSTYQSKLIYLQLLKKYAQVHPYGGHIFFSIFKSKFLNKDLEFFKTKNIVKVDDFFTEIGENEGCSSLDDLLYENIFLFGGIMEEVKPDYEPAIGDLVAANEDFYASNGDQFDFLKGTQMMVENIDPEDGSVFVSNTDWQKKQWISHEDFINITDLKF